jgi:hypothetical protein
MGVGCIGECLREIRIGIFLARTRGKMKTRKLLSTACMIMFMGGCSEDPLIGDYDVPITGKYRLVRTSADEVQIGFIATEFRGCVPAKVVGIAWNTNFIVAKQQKLKERGDFPGDTLPVPAPGQFAYWIIDVRSTNCVGPLTETDYLTKVRSLGLEQLQIQGVSKTKFNK